MIEPKIKITVHLNRDQAQFLKVQSAISKISTGAVVRDAVDQLMKKS
jgi:hypothetical protein